MGGRIGPVTTGIVLLVVGGLWMAGNVTDLSVPWERVLPGALVVVGLGLVAGTSRWNAPPSQFEGDDAPPVP